MDLISSSLGIATFPKSASVILGVLLFTAEWVAVAMTCWYSQTNCVLAVL